MKHKIIALALLSASLLTGSPTTYAQSVGEWHMYSLFSGGVTKIVDAKNKVYYTSANRLYSYDKRTTETYSYSTENVLNDSNVTNIYYNAEKGFLVVVYDTSNIDVILDKDDSVVNMSDISIANLTYTKTINDVSFNENRIYVATAFGLVVFDSDKFTVVESGIYGKNVGCVTVSGDVLLIYTSDKNYYVSSKNSRHNTFDKFTFWRTGAANGILGTDNGFYEFQTGKNLYQYVIDWNTLTTLQTVDTGVSNIKSYGTNVNGDTYFVSNSTILFVNKADGSVINTVTLPDEVASQRLDFSKDLSSVWVGDAKGVGCYNIDDGNASVVVSKSIPESISCDKVAYIRGAKDGSRVYISNIGRSRYKSCAVTVGNAEWIQQHTDVIVDGVPHDASLTVASAYKPDVIANQKANNSTAMFGGPGRFDVDPEDPEKYVISNGFEGFYVCKNNEEIGRFDNTNAPIYNWWTKSARGAVGYNVEFDPKGNLWIGYWAYGSGGKYSPYLMLPRSKFTGDLSAITADDWQMSKHIGMDQGNQDMGSLFCKKSTFFFTWHSISEGLLGVYDTKGTYDDTSDDVYIELENLKDTDGNSFSPTRWICAAEDQTGAVWFGSTSGIVKIPDPKKVKDVSYQVTRPKVPRNDGTNYADYLLDSEQINDISVDAANHKWICTENSGLYCVSADGDEILEQFTTDNSPLPTNAPQSVYCDPYSNLVYIGYTGGLITYRSTTSPAQSDYSAVLAYPNPVRPDYTGYITVSGLMENSLVKIADASGNVVFQTRSSGGMAVWDGCNADGSRVNTGVYFVLASQNENDNATSVVTKILVVK